MGSATEIKERIGKRHVVFFDGVCNLCNGFVNFLIDQDKGDNLMFASLQSPEAALLLPSEITSSMDSVVVLSPKGKIFRESEAVIELCRIISGPYAWFTALGVLPAGIRNGIYRWVARNRYKWFGKEDTCRVPTVELEAKFI